MGRVARFYCELRCVRRANDRHNLLAGPLLDLGPEEGEEVLRSQEASSTSSRVPLEVTATLVYPRGNDSEASSEPKGPARRYQSAGLW